MKSDKGARIAQAILWFAILGATLYMAIHGLSVIVDSTSKIVAAILTGLFGLVGAYVTHVLSVQSQRDAERLRRKQDCYAEIMQRLVPYIRSKGEGADELAPAVLYSYVVADETVAKAICDFTKSRTSDKLDEIVESMRKDLGMPSLNGVAPTTGLLPPPSSVGKI